MQTELEDGLRAILGWWGDVGVDVPAIPETAKRRPSTQKNTISQSHVAPQSTSIPTKTTPVQPPLSSLIARKAKTLDDLKTAMQNFDAGALSDGARQCVFARGNPKANIMIIGETPGIEEDMQGKPFVGRAGLLLDRMLAAIGLSEDDVYITDSVNWRPQKNRNPKADEIALCRPFLQRHIEFVAPKILVLVGGVALKSLTGLDGIMKQRGVWQDVVIEGEAKLAPIPAIPLYHPAFLMRQPVLKKEAWRDLLALKAKIDQLKEADG